jgi:sulfonate transport system substrate-binding protein
MRNIPYISRLWKNSRRFALAILAGLLPLFAWSQATADKSNVEFRIGWQKGSHLALVKARGTLENQLNATGVRVRWIEFTAGPQMLEGLNVGSIDLACVGETPPIFAQAASDRLIYVAFEPPAPAAEKVLVPKSSPIRSFSELKGKRIVLNRGSNVHYLLLKLLEKHQLNYSDVQVIYLPPSDARAAFESGSVDAWVIWDPFAQAAIAQIGARVLAGAEGLAHNYNFYLSTSSFAKAHPDILKRSIAEIHAQGQWVRKYPEEAAAILAPQIGLTKEVTLESLKHYSYDTQTPVTPEVIANQQAIADAFFTLKLIPKKLEVERVIWKP